MDKRITFRGQDRSEAIANHIDQQLEKIEDLLKEEPSPVFIEVTVELHDVHAQNKVTALIKSPHFSCYASHEGQDIYEEINEVLDRTYKQLRRQKEELVDRHKDGCDNECKKEYFEKINLESRPEKGTSEEDELEDE